MNPALGLVAVAVIFTSDAFAQTPPADPFAVKPLPSQAQSPESDPIRTKIEQAGYTNVTGLSRDSMGVWRARAKRGTETVDVIVDKGGRIKTEPQ